MSIPRGQLVGITVDVQPHGKPGAADVLEQGVKAVESRLGSEFDVFSVFAHGVQQMTHLGQGPAAGLLDASQCVAGLG